MVRYLVRSRNGAPEAPVPCPLLHLSLRPTRSFKWVFLHHTNRLHTRARGEVAGHICIRHARVYLVNMYGAL